MKNTNKKSATVTKLVARFDNELKNILMNDLKAIRNNQFLAAINNGFLPAA